MKGFKEFLLAETSFVPKSQPFRILGKPELDPANGKLMFKSYYGRKDTRIPDGKLPRAVIYTTRASTNMPYPKEYIYFDGKLYPINYNDPSRGLYWTDGPIDPPEARTTSMEDPDEFAKPFRWLELALQKIVTSSEVLRQEKKQELLEKIQQMAMGGASKQHFISPEVMGRIRAKVNRLIQDQSARGIALNGHEIIRSLGLSRSHKDAPYYQTIFEVLDSLFQSTLTAYMDETWGRQVGKTTLRDALETYLSNVNGEFKAGVSDKEIMDYAQREATPQLIHIDDPRSKGLGTQMNKLKMDMASANNQDDGTLVDTAKDYLHVLAGCFGTPQGSVLTRIMKAVTRSRGVLSLLDKVIQRSRH